ncbi:conserved exported hypothetical protein [Capnocytophaga canis]|uniref:outer membrane beta-barrel protein n=1 Tax=Capnocytophaga canis TaxID=1848903 RepID=UPI0005897C08|nr:outer membrane beta-barrel protein [Capnocytophaga canis]CEN44321.1 conserved exported hypothetical protein [Capnocytophaga canis]
MNKLFKSIKKVVLPLFVLLNISFLLAQDKDNKIHWGIKGGLNYSRLAAVYPLQDGLQGKDDIFFGGFATVKTSLPAVNSFLFEITYSGQGVYYEDMIENRYIHYNLPHLSIGYKARFKLHEHIFYQFGFSTDFLLRKNDITSEFQNFDTTVSLFGFEFIFSKKISVFLDGKIGLRRSNIKNDIIPFERNVTNRVVRFGVCYYIK